ncbi:hypothetical protein BJ170DRAFT_683524 [Xylariales sp. AK1849]|nr:hypothetical protein BJ170DRAFT_683524 [Xylariales sp. AK1849]
MGNNTAVERKNYRRSIRRVLSAVRTLYGHYNENIDHRDPCAAPPGGGAAFPDVADVPPANPFFIIPDEPPQRSFPRLPRVGHWEASWRTSAPPVPTNSELAIHQQHRQRSRDAFWPYHGFNVVVPGVDPGPGVVPLYPVSLPALVIHDFLALPVEERDSFWDSLSYFTYRRPPTDKPRCAFQGEHESGYIIKARIFNFVQNVLATPPQPPNNPQHPRFREYIELQLRSRRTDPDWGELSLLRCLYTNRLDAGPGREMLFEEMLPIVADYFFWEIVVFTPDAPNDDAYQNSRRVAERKSWQVHVYGHSNAHARTRKQIMLCCDEERKRWAPVVPPAGTVSPATYLFPTGHLTGTRRWHFSMPWWPAGAPGTLTNAQVEPAHLGANANAAWNDPWLLHPNANTTRHFEGYRDCSGNMLRGRMPEWPTVGERAGWLVANPPNTAVTVDPALEHDRMHASSGITFDPWTGDFTRPRWTSTTVSKYHELKDEIERRDLRTTPQDEVDAEYDRERNYLSWGQW